MTLQPASAVPHHFPSSHFPPSPLPSRRRPRAIPPQCRDLSQSLPLSLPPPLPLPVPLPPDSSGKSLTGVAAAARIHKSVLVLCTSAVSVDQWKQQFLLWSTLPEHQVPHPGPVLSLFFLYFLVPSYPRALSFRQPRPNCRPSTGWFDPAFLFSRRRRPQVCRFTSAEREWSDLPASVFITTYNMIAFNGRRAAESSRIIEKASLDREEQSGSTSTSPASPSIPFFSAPALPTSFFSPRLGFFSRIKPTCAP